VPAAAGRTGMAGVVVGVVDDVQFSRRERGFQQGAHPLRPSRHGNTLL
jgi:hypothetical protein